MMCVVPILVSFYYVDIVVEDDARDVDNYCYWYKKTTLVVFSRQHGNVLF
jgi:hypothetical protein